jgi:2-dehydro-3-deoxyphosphogluconate aldolase/(4S)-4-hydroxy-2-oxoglutarate aldolase
MNKSEVMARIRESGLVAVVRASSADEAKKITSACMAGGVAAVEITFTVPGALEVIRELAAKYRNDGILIGAGTVLDPETAAEAIDAGAQFIVSPYLNPETVKLCVSRGIACMPGAMTVREAAECMAAGADAVKIFPGELFGPAIIKAIKGPLPEIEMMPTGGVSLDNVQDWIKAGAFAVGVGGTATAKHFIERIKEARR